MEHLALPNNNLRFDLSDRLIHSFEMWPGDRSLSREDAAGDSPEGRIWRLSYRSFTLKELKALLAEEWSIPPSLVTITADRKLEPKLQLELPEGTSIRWPTRV